MPGISGSGGFGGFTFGEYVSEVIHFNNNNVLTATPNINILSSGKSYGLFLSNDDGVTWESATNETQHNFSTTGQKLRLRIVGESGFQVGASLQSDGKTYKPAIRVDYTTA